MVKGTYNGGHTVIGPHTPEWFGPGGNELTGRDEHDRLRKARERYDALCQEGRDGRTGSLYRRPLKAVRQELLAAEKAVKSLGRRIVMTSEIEREIASLRRHIAGLAAQARSAVKLHEVERARLEELLMRSNLDTSRYPEVGKLKF